MISRRRFLQASASVALVPVLARLGTTKAFATTSSTTISIRPNWDTFCSGPLYSVYTQTIATMRANSNTADPNSWGYWANTHKSYCPHKLPYFMAWHRGLLSRFESRLRQISGNPDLAIPYWDYYTSPAVPSQFLVAGSPLYRSGRTGDNVQGALSMAAFADTIVNFPRGETDAFEPTLETAPHNPVHNLIGGIMSNVAYSPYDPLFWVHHANIDRLWSAWVNAGNGRTMPASTDSYWTGYLNYGPAIRSMPRSWTQTTDNTYLHYRYDDETMPQQAAAYATPAAPMTLATAQALPSRPLTTQTVSLGGAQQLALDEHSMSINVPLTPTDRNRVRSLLLQPASPATSGSMRVVLDGIRLTALGKEGGYFYKVFVNLPDAGSVAMPEKTYLLGMVGAFEIGAQQMQAQMQGHGMQGMASMDTSAANDQPVSMSFPMTAALQKIWPQNLDKLTISFVRVDGGRPRRGRVILVKEFRVEAANP